MDFFCGLSEISETKGMKSGEISKKASEKFDRLMGDDNLSEVSAEQQEDIIPKEPDYSEKREPNSVYEFNGNTYETDENGQTYKKNGEILPDIEYTANGNVYKTDGNGNKISCDSNPEYTEKGSRNMKEQKESGGEERREDDDGGHIIARILSGSEGEENLVPMRRTINRGDYKRMENEIAKALQEGKGVSVHIKMNTTVSQADRQKSGKNILLTAKRRYVSLIMLRVLRIYQSRCQIR